MPRLLITGGAGFIGSHFTRYLLQTYSHYEVVVLDKLTYAGNLANLADIERSYAASGRYRFIKGDICNPQIVASAIADCTHVVHFAAESHVDRSIENPGQFITTDVYGTYMLLEQARRQGIERFVQISTDEIYGPVLQGYSKESDRAIPSNPYSASKAGGEMLAHAYFVTYGTPVIITRGSNTYGPYQHPEKLIPRFITNVLQNLPLTLYGDGEQRRDWIYVLDHCKGIDIALHKGTSGEIYNIGGGNEYSNLQITHLVLEALEKPQTLITYIQDRLGHDRRYALDRCKLQQLGWQPEHSFEEALNETVQWYCEHEAWWRAQQPAQFDSV